MEPDIYTALNKVMSLIGMLLDQADLEATKKEFNATQSFLQTCQTKPQAHDHTKLQASSQASSRASSPSPSTKRARKPTTCRRCKAYFDSNNALHRHLPACEKATKSFEKRGFHTHDLLGQDHRRKPNRTPSSVGSPDSLIPPVGYKTFTKYFLNQAKSVRSPTVRSSSPAPSTVKSNSPALSTVKPSSIAPSIKPTLPPTPPASPISISTQPDPLPPPPAV